MSKVLNALGPLFVGYVCNDYIIIWTILKLNFPENKRPQTFRKGEAKAVSGHYLLKSGVDFLEGGVDCASGLAERGIQSCPTIEH